MGLIFFGNIVYDLIAILVTILCCLIAYMRWALNYWERQNVPTLPGSCLFGNFGDAIMQKRHICLQYKKIYDVMRSKGESFAGAYLFHLPVYVPIGHENIQQVMQSSFSNFTDRGLYVNEKEDPLSGNLFSLGSPKWNVLRKKLSPTFTKDKMKMMFHTVSDCSVGLTNLIDQQAQKGEAIDIKDTLARFGTDVIGSCAFGIKCNCMKNPDTEFRTYGEKAFKFRLRGLLQILIPHNVLRYFGFTLTFPDIEEFFMRVVKETVDFRETKQIECKDFMQLLIKMKNLNQLTMEELAAQCFVFFLAGFETSSTTNTFTLLELALHQDIQDKVREEIKEVLARHNNEITYESISEMTYMEQVVNEALRKYPPVAILNRICTQDFTIPGTSVQIKKDAMVVIPVMGIHYDPTYFPNPETFDPERFGEENKKEIPPFAFLPFGAGPRICIGMRFGMFQVKTALVAILKDYKITLNEKTQFPLEYDSTTFVLAVKGGVWLNAEKIG